MYIIAAVFVDDISMREVDGSTRIDFTGIQFSSEVEDNFPMMFAPHLAVLIRSDIESSGTGVLEVTYLRNGSQIARNAQPLQIEPGMFAYRLVRAEMEFDGPGSVEAHCRIDKNEPLIIPYTLKARQ
ncbi:MAG: hypothetical protein CL470_03205 [Acidimicrobiaceae bacterium]|nr:hypothetical protein [Acidimicrobiaceae bacterium]